MRSLLSSSMLLKIGEARASTVPNACKGSEVARELLRREASCRMGKTHSPPTFASPTEHISVTSAVESMVSSEMLQRVVSEGAIAG